MTTLWYFSWYLSAISQRGWNLIFEKNTSLLVTENKEDFLAVSALVAMGSE